MNRSKRSILVFLQFLITITGAQTSGFFRPFGEMDTKFEEPRIEDTLPKSLDEFTPIERPIDPESYILGPGDVLGVNIVITESYTYTLRVNPTGELLIPSVGILTVSGLSLAAAVDSIKNFISPNVGPVSFVDVTLVDVRQFLILVVGGVQDPGFVTITPADRLTDVITEAGGLHKYGDEEEIKVIRINGDIEHVSLKKFLLEGDLENNPTFQEGDYIEVPFQTNYKMGADDFTTFNESAVLVTGFVKRPGAFRYFPGYTVRDYIGMAGGVLETGTINRVTLYRSGEKQDAEFNEFAKPGDTLYIPSNFRYVFFGRGSMFQIISASVALLLTYDRLTK